ncbi:MAG: hypothetical protein IKR92_06465 [Alphaproteobacteria bacterium]|nr:hypothetical protein [Alphaproteobacteria bacterium]
MTEQKNKYRMLLTPKQIDELTAIYDDYLYMVRQYEMVLQTAPVEVLAQFQVEQVYNNQKRPEYPWKWGFLSSEEKKEFKNLNNDVLPQNLNHSYISLSHTNPAEDMAEPLQFVPEGYWVYTMDKHLPAAVERYLITYPDNAVIGNTEFLIDGTYKARYDGENAEQPISEFFEDPKHRIEFRTMIHLINKCRENRYEHEYQRKRQLMHLYAAEVTEPWEHTILEIIGSFAEKMQSVCRDIYGREPEELAFESAEKDGLIPSAKDFQDYVNIRHLLRHQWETMDEIGTFYTPSENAETRAKWVKSYLRLCDKSIVQRQRSYIDVLRQYQHVIGRIMPERILREQGETNSKFVARLKELHRQNPDKEFSVELNYPLTENKFTALQKNLRKVFPNIKIAEDFAGSKNDFSSWETDYARRSWFLHSFNRLECKLISYCVSRGENLRGRKAWNYVRDHKLISENEYQTWRGYKDLRNELSHNYYSPALRQKLCDIEEQYIKHQVAFEQKLYDMAPVTERLRNFVYQATHKDGLCVTIDYKNRKFLHGIKHSNEPQFKQLGKIDLPQQDKRTAQTKSGPKTETYPNGVAYTLSGGKITSFKMPNGVTVNLEKQRISWANDVQFHTNAEHFNVLQTANYKLMTDKDLRVTEFFEKNRKQKVRGGDTCILEYKHRAYIDTIGRLKEFSFKKADGQVAKTIFKQTKDGSSVLFADGTCIALRGKDMVVTHNGYTLTKDTRQEFAASYSDTSRIPPQIIKSGNGR